MEEATGSTKCEVPAMKHNKCCVRSMRRMGSGEFEVRSAKYELRNATIGTKCEVNQRQARNRAREGIAKFDKPRTKCQM